MRLERFRVCNFRSVNDSGWIEVAKTTAFVGRNESGKTTLLEALASLNGSESMKTLSRSRDFPADRLYTDFSESLTVLRTVWSLDPAEAEALSELLPDGVSLHEVEIGRSYGTEPWVRFHEAPEREDIQSRALELLKRVVAVPAAAGAPPDASWVFALDALTTAAERPCEDRQSWVRDVVAGLSGLQEPLSAGLMALDAEGRAALEGLGELATTVSGESQLESVARDWVFRRLPRFLYLDRYPMVDGNQNLREFAARQQERRLSAADRYFGMLLRVAGIDPERIGELLEAEPEIRRQTASRAGAVLTRTLRRIWTDRPLKVRFHIDGDHFNTIVSDPTSVCDVEVNLNQRSRGFRWFFSFYVMLAAGSRDGSTAQALLLLDEPGLHLHATGQQDLLQHLSNDLSNQVLFATQSPYLIPEGPETGLRAVEFDEGVGTHVRNDGQRAHVLPLPAGTPLEPSAEAPQPAPAAAELPETHPCEETPCEQTSLEETPPAETEGRSAARAAPAPLDPALAQLEGRTLLFVEEITDYWYLEVASEHLAEAGRSALPEGVSIVLAAAHLLPLLASQLGEDADFLVLASEKPESTAPYQDRTLWLGDYLDDAGAGRSVVDLEDLLDAKRYGRFVRYTYREHISDRPLSLDPEIPRIVERYRRALAGLGLDFHRSTPARTFMLSAARKPELMMNDETIDRLERLFDAIGARCAGEAGKDA